MYLWRVHVTCSIMKATPVLGLLLVLNAGCTARQGQAWRDAGLALSTGLSTAGSSMSSSAQQRQQQRPTASGSGIVCLQAGDCLLGEACVATDSSGLVGRCVSATR